MSSFIKGWSLAFRIGVFIGFYSSQKAVLNSAARFSAAHPVFIVTLYLVLFSIFSNSSTVSKYAQFIPEELSN